MKFQNQSGVAFAEMFNDPNTGNPTLKAGYIDVGNLDIRGIIKNGVKWELNQDGSGFLANKNINWDASGNTNIGTFKILSDGSTQQIGLPQNAICEITATNKDNFLSTISGESFLDFVKTGTYIKAYTPLSVKLPSFGFAGGEKDLARSLVGTEVALYNYSSGTCGIASRWTTAQNGEAVMIPSGYVLRCKCIYVESSTYGSETIVWEIGRAHV